MNKQEYEDMLKAMQQDAEGGNSQFWRPGSNKEGKFPIRVLPPMKKNDERVFYFSHKTHFIDGIPFECANQTLVDKSGELHQAEPCPVCNYVSKLFNASEKGTDEWKLASELSARKRYISRIIVRGKDDETTPEFYEYGKKIFEKLYNILTESDFGNIVDLKDGRDFIIHKVGTGRNSAYDNSMPSLDKTPAFDNKEDLLKVLSKATEMKYNDLIEFRTVEEMTSALKNYLRGGADEEDVPEAKPERAKSAPRKQAVKDTVREDRDYNDFEGEDDDSFSEDPELETDEIDDILSEFTN